MTLAFLFWLFMIIWFVFGIWQGWPAANPPSPFVIGGHVLLFILFLLLGIQVFGWPIRA